MIYTLTLNPTIDHTLTIDQFSAGGTFKASQSARRPAGKGINVAHVVATLGEPVVALGLVGKEDEPAFAASLGQAGIENQLVAVPGGTRISVTVLDPEQQTETHLREPGIAPPSFALAQVGSQLARLSPVDWVVMAGSLPPGIPVDAYGGLIHICTSVGAKTCLDANGAPLLAGANAAPSLLKLNLFELCQINGQDGEGLAEQQPNLSFSEIVAIAGRVQARGSQTVVVTLGERGAIGVDPSGVAWHAQVKLDRRVVDAVGSGDAMGAGLVVSLQRGESLQRALCLGVACGAANTLTVGAGRCSKTDITRLLARAEVRLLA